MNPEQKKKLQDFYSENKHWLRNIVQSSSMDPVVKAMALVVLKEGSRKGDDEK